MKPASERSASVADSFDVRAPLSALGLSLPSDDDGPARLIVRNPADGSVVSQIAQTSLVATADAIDRSEVQGHSWRGRTARDRGRLLARWHELIQRHAQDLAAVLTAEQGKPLAEAQAEVQYAAGYVEWYSQEAARAYGEVIPPHREHFHLKVVREPAGVCAAITPWNFPLAMVARKAAPALAAGCTMIVKPSELTPLSAIALVTLAERAGIPPGVLQVIVGDKPHSTALGKLLCESPTVRKLSFTGSTPVGKVLAAQCAGTVKRLSLELGGNAPFIVFEDADIELAVQGAIASKFRNAGQTCVCANRFLVHQAVAERFSGALAAASAQLIVGPGHLPGVQVGPLVEAAAAAKVRRLITQTLAVGGRLRCGDRPSLATPPDGLFVRPTVIDHVPAGSEITATEIFGPVAPIQTFASHDEAIQLANGTPYGLAAYVYSERSRHLHRVADALQFGIVGLNTGLISTEVAPIGGVKQSGYGKEGGREGMADYLTSKYLCEAA
jgi:succinate-semialdehyde dehydrogenase / glutarate-semialdehyde dehydrogenase